VNGNDYGFMVGAGVPVEFLRLYYQQPQRGAAAAVRVLVMLIASLIRHERLAHDAFTPITAEVRCEGTPLPFTSYSVIYASTIEEIGLGFRPTPRAREQRGRFQIFAGAVSAGAFVRSLPAIYGGRPTGLRDISDALTSALDVEFRQPTFYMIDGDIMERTAHLTVAPGPLVRVVRR
jgi:diacylglycerol kinase family enzyme